MIVGIKTIIKIRPNEKRSALSLENILFKLKAKAIHAPPTIVPLVLSNLIISSVSPKKLCYKRYNVFLFINLLSLNFQK